MAAYVTGSVSLLSEGVHSGTDLIASSITLLSVHISAAPPDEQHPFGHGKIESLTGFAEAIMVLCAVVFIAFEAVRRLIARHSLNHQTLSFGLVVMAFSAVASLVISLYMLREARRTLSTALTVNAGHLRVDFITSLGVFAGLAITKITGQAAADPIIAIMLAGWMSYSAIMLCVRAFQELIDVKLPEEEIVKIRAVLDAEQRVISYHRLRTRLSGSVRNIDLHIVVPREWSVVQAHQVADDLEKQIRAVLSPADVVIHVDPFDPAKARA